MHAGLGHCLIDGETAAGQERRLQEAIGISFGKLREVVHLIAFGLFVSGYKLIESLWNREFFCFYKVGFENQQKPVAVCHENVVEKFAQVFVMSCRVVFMNRREQQSVRVPLVADQVVKRFMHSDHLNREIRAVGEWIRVPFCDLCLFSCGWRDPVLEEDEIEKAIKLVADFTEMGNAFEAEAFKEAERSGVLCVDSGDHRVFTGDRGQRDQGLEES